MRAIDRRTADEQQANSSEQQGEQQGNSEKTYLECAKLLQKFRIDSTRGLNKWMKFGGGWESLKVSTDPKLKTCPIF